MRQAFRGRRRAAGIFAVLDLDHCPTRHGENSGQLRSAAVAQAFDLSLWQLVQGLGILDDSVIDGGMNLNVWLRTITSPIVCSIAGMWQLTHSLPVDPAR